MNPRFFHLRRESGNIKDESRFDPVGGVTVAYDLCEINIPNVGKYLGAKIGLSICNWSTGGGDLFDKKVGRELAQRRLYQPNKVDSEVGPLTMMLCLGLMQDIPHVVLEDGSLDVNSTEYPLEDTLSLLVCQHLSMTMVYQSVDECSEVDAVLCRHGSKKVYYIGAGFPLLMDEDSGGLSYLDEEETVEDDIVLDRPVNETLPSKESDI